jgi:methylenetetrahydrofolate dehydrogenase (NADP+)/methenyltetrahydrofolate cyclohydrolase
VTKILDGKALNLSIAERLKEEIAKLTAKPKLVIIQVGSRPESNTYIKHKLAFAARIGAPCEHIELPESVSEERLLSEVAIHNADRDVHGVIVQVPLPRHLSEDAIMEAIAPEKAVDGSVFFTPATARGVLSLLEHYKVPIAGKKAVVVGRSRLVGEPIALALLDRDATVTICHSKTKNVAKETQAADILIAAAGKPKLIGAKHVRKGQTVVDVGINSLNGKLVGDVDFEKVSKTVKLISPVPGGVGPMTVASLFENLLDAYKLQTE